MFELARHLHRPPSGRVTELLNALLELGCETLGSSFGTLSRVHGDEYVFEAVTAPTTADLEAGRTTRSRTSRTADTSSNTANRSRSGR